MKSFSNLHIKKTASINYKAVRVHQISHYVSCRQVFQMVF